MQEHTTSFGYWLRRRRKALDLTQEALAVSVSCSRFAIRKIEADERRPSRRLAERIADRLGIPPEDRAAFMSAARGMQPADQLTLDHTPQLLGKRTSTGQVPTRETAALDAGGMRAPEPGQLPFVGRTSEFGELIGLVARLSGGQGCVFLVEGEPGIGKSRLLHEIAEHAHGLGLALLSANCYEIERGMPYQPVVELVAQAANRCAASTLQKLDPASLAELAALSPAVARRVPNVPTPAAELPEARQARLFQAIGQLMEALAEEVPTLLIIDDVHWTDDASLRFLHFFARGLASKRVLLVLAYRCEEIAADGALATLIRSLQREPHSRCCLLRRLSVADTRALLVESKVPSLQIPGVLEWLYRETAGHPFYLASILQSLADQGLLQSDESWTKVFLGHAFALSSAPSLPEAVRASVRGRLARIPRAALEVLEVAAVLGRQFDFDTLQAVMQRSESELLDALDTLLRRHLLIESEIGTYDFSHDKIREVVYLDLTGAKKKLLHRAVARVLAAQPAADVSERAARLAEHWERAQEWENAVASLMQAAARSENLFATREALHLLDRAVELSETHALDLDLRSRLLERRGSVRAQAGNASGAVIDLNRAIEIVRQEGDLKRERDLLVHLGMTFRRGDHYRRAVRCLEQALAASRAMRDEHCAADTLYHLGTVAWSSGRNDLALAHHQEAVEISERLKLADRVAVQAFHGRGEASLADALPIEAVEWFSRSLELARGIGEKSYECENLTMIGWAYSGWVGLGDYARTITHCEMSLPIAESSGFDWHIGPALIARDFARACIGDYRHSFDGLKQTLHRLQALQLPRYQIMAYNMLGHLLLDLGRPADALPYLDRGIEYAREAKITFWTAALHANRAIARTRLGQSAADDDLEERLRATEACREHWMQIRLLEALAEISLAQGGTDHCLEYADRLMELAKHGHLAEMQAQAHRWRGAALLQAKDYVRAEGELNQARDTADAVGRLRLLWDVNRALAQAARGQENPEKESHYSALARSIAQRITENLAGSELVAELPDAY